MCQINRFILLNDVSAFTLGCRYSVEDLPGIKQALGIEDLLDRFEQRQLLGRAGVLQPVLFQKPDAVLGRDAARIFLDDMKQILVRLMTAL